METVDLLVTPREVSVSSTDVSTGQIHTNSAADAFSTVGVENAKGGWYKCEEFNDADCMRCEEQNGCVRLFQGSSNKTNRLNAREKYSDKMLMDPKHTAVIIIQMIFLIMLCVFGTLINSLVFWVFNRRPALRSLSNRFVLSLVTANILISSMIAPLILFETILNEYVVLPCIVEVISMISNAVIFAAIFSTFLIAVDRFYAVTSPLHYSMTITRSRSQIMIVVAWLSGALLALPYIIICSIPTDDELRNSLQVFFVIFQTCLGYVFPFVGLFWLYARMYNAAHRNSERTRKHSISGELLTVMDGSTSMIPQGIDFLTHYMNPFSKTPMAGSVQPTVPPAAGKKHRRRSSNGSSSSLLFREEGRAIKTAFLVLASFLLCWTPHFTFMLVKQVEVVKLNLSTLVPLKGEWSRFFGVGGMLLSSVVNPFIYVFRNKMACKEVSKLLCGFWRKKKDSQNGMKDRRYEGSGSARSSNNEIEYQNSHHPLLQHHNHHHVYTPSTKSPKRSSMKSLTPQSSLNSTITNVHSVGPDSPLLLPSRFTSANNNIINNNNNSTASSCSNINNNYKHPFIRSLTLPEQTSTQPRVKFPPNLIRQKSFYPRSTGSAELTPALSKKSRFVRQDSICSVTSNDSVLMICAEDGVSVTDIGIGPGSTGAAQGQLSGLTGRYLRQDSNFSDASHKTIDSGVVIDMGKCVNGTSNSAASSSNNNSSSSSTTSSSSSSNSSTSSNNDKPCTSAEPMPSSSSAGTLTMSVSKGANDVSPCNGKLAFLQTTI